MSLAVITGASSGIGKEFAYQLKEKLGVDELWLVARSTAKMEAIAEELSYAEQTKNKILKYIRTSYSTATLTEAARLLGLSPTYLSRWICSSFNESFKELLMKERFSVAQDLLSTTDTAIGDIIIHIGYENSSYFHKEFKKRFGVTPKEYRKRFSAPPSKNSFDQ